MADTTVQVSPDPVRAQTLALQRFFEGTLKGHGVTSISSLIFTVGVVGLLVGGPVFWVTLITMAIGAILEFLSCHNFNKDWAPDSVEPGRSPGAKIRRLNYELAIIMAAYCAPLFLLAFCPMPGPVIGLLVSFAAFTVVCGQHTVSRSMVYFTLPFPALASLACLFALGQGALSHVLMLLGVVLIANIFNLTRKGVIASERLISAQINAEQAAVLLEARVRERTAQLEEATLEAESANIAKSHFLASVTHELRTPLNAIIGYSEILREIAQEDARVSDVADLDRVHGAARQLLTIVNDILDFTMIDVGRGELRLDSTDAGETARAAARAIRSVMVFNKNTFIEEIDDLGVCRTDAVKLNQCLHHLLSNAAKFTRDGTVKFSAHRVAEPLGDVLEFRVIDTGIGIDRDKRAILFEPFVQADGTATRQFGGTGLGLAITRRLARLLGGDVTAESQLGEGSSFVLRIPAILQAGEDLLRHKAA